MIARLRGGWLAILTLIAYLGLGFALLFYRDNPSQPEPTQPVRRSRVIWSLWLIAGVYLFGIRRRWR